MAMTISPSDPAPPSVMPPLSYGVLRVTFACPACGKARAFKSEPARVTDPLTWPARCSCGAYLGQYIIGIGPRRERVRLLRLAGPEA